MAENGGGGVRQRRGGTEAAAASAAANGQQQQQQERVEEVDSDEAEEIERKRQEKKPTARQRVAAEDGEDEDAYSPWLDVVRVLSFLALASCALSYLVSGGESLVWSVRQWPPYMQVEWWKTQLRGPIYLTPEELARYDGSDAALPIYLAINGTVYDVSANARTYGPGGSYRFFAGADASRGFVTGCFAEDRTPDMRGVERMYLPLEPEDDEAAREANAHWSAAELDALRAEEAAAATQRVHDALAHWVRFFANNPKYPLVGYVRRDPGWLDGAPVRELCKSAAKGRRPRKVPEERKERKKVEEAKEEAEEGGEREGKD
ncbi:putative heme binding protein [Xylariaceae sp. FL0804]|nr:putative heme binding protein [Xylariaceae sp. FL0804]